MVCTWVKFVVLTVSYDSLQPQYCMDALCGERKKTAEKDEMIWSKTPEKLLKGLLVVIVLCKTYAVVALENLA